MARAYRGLYALSAAPPDTRDPSRPLILASTTFDQCPWMQIREVPAGTAEGVVRTLPAGSHGFVDLLVIRVLARRRVNFCKAETQSSRAGEKCRKVRRIDLRQFLQDIEQAAQAPRDRQIHSLPHDRLRQRLGLSVSTVVQDLDEPDLGCIELLHHFQGMVVSALFDFMPFERRTNEDGNDELLLQARHLRHRKYGSGSGALPARTDQNRRRVLAQQRLDFAPRLLQRGTRDIRVVPRSEPPRRPGSYEEAFLRWHVGQRELVGIEESRGNPLPETVGVRHVGLLRHRQVALDDGLQRTQNVAASAAQAENEYVHVIPSCFSRALT